MKKEHIGNGAHWTVYRITTDEKDLSTSIVFKQPLKYQTSDKNIENYNLVLSSNLPTLSKFSKKNINGVEGIEAEDLNPKNCDGYYVSPNTVRTSENLASLLVKYIDGSQPIIPDEYKDVILDYMKDPEKAVNDRDKLLEIKILKGAEKYVYENKISVISNFNSFLIKLKTDMKRASDNRIELFSDAFFFRVSETTKEIDYKIADFDCIVSKEKTNISPVNLLKGNMSYFETALIEFIELFIEKAHKEAYITELKNVK
ncbi:hypothetical protein SAMN05444671_4329 [Flavobacterium sp. CF108]|uniref:hypothetical protein n=1 Tax=Flavobacterium sp. CF108 TaxID=1882758 RepID=UPI00091453B6|nr:hypothetical protein [Flavobacterium sp. CF108]SHH92801.1 hypothetical protein SAMN05444671_4329 [Flavobacterium sp. CF108]